MVKWPDEGQLCSCEERQEVFASFIQKEALAALS
jgi:hypothetical protein